MDGDDWILIPTQSTSLLSAALFSCQPPVCDVEEGAGGRGDSPPRVHRHVGGEVRADGLQGVRQDQVGGPDFVPVYTFQIVNYQVGGMVLYMAGSGRQDVAVGGRIR